MLISGLNPGKIRFEVTAPALVIVYKPEIDNVYKPPSVTLNGFKYALLLEQLVAKGVYVCMYVCIYTFIIIYLNYSGDHEDDQDIFYNGYGRYVDAEVGTIEISVGNEFGSNIDMHVVVIVELSRQPFCLNLLSQIFLDTFPLDVTGMYQILRVHTNKHTPAYFTLT